MYLLKGIGSYGCVGVLLVFALMTPSEGAIKCLQCDSKANADCSDNTKITASDCADTLADATECFVSNDGTVVTRGCLAKDQACNSPNCLKCTGNAETGCNTNNISLPTEFQCIVCRSDENKDCWNDATKFTGQKCRTGDSSPEDGCFHGVWNSVAIRGCYIDADAKTKATCADATNNQCKLCHTANCNTEKSSSGAQSIGIFMGLIMAMLSVVYYVN
ncbi:uncharacterized protein LOC101899648 [Musca domestica]|uniref:Uncharacterized protein LOC101899648 n=1 Tax=Musca domestica TaxID=7370 RepID=A0A1I8NBH1_MUSDO|nr:uncharacterized protein LOC101899648 [Musca domestica]XP_011294173.1 uncharacterized protein LOC101899648 [Musca domestica]